MTVRMVVLGWVVGESARLKVRGQCLSPQSTSRRPGFDVWPQES